MPPCSTKQYIEKQVASFGYRLLGEYVHNSTRRVCISDSDGYKYDIALETISSSHPFAHSSNPFSLNNISLWLSKNNTEIYLSENNTYDNASKNLDFYHTKCKEKFVSSWRAIFAGQGCGVCKGRQVGEKTSLGYLRPDISNEWHPYKNSDITPYDVTRGTNKKIWWICPFGHEYTASVSNRVKGRGCPHCSNGNKESKIASKLKSWALERFGKYNCDIEHPVVKNSKTNCWLKCDIYIGEPSSINGVYIEINGRQHYEITGWTYKHAMEKGITPEAEFRYTKYLDKLKKQFAKKNGVYVELDLRKIKTIDEAIIYVTQRLETL